MIISDGQNKIIVLEVKNYNLPKFNSLYRGNLNNFQGYSLLLIEVTYLKCIRGV